MKKTMIWLLAIGAISGCQQNTPSREGGAAPPSAPLRTSAMPVVPVKVDDLSFEVPPQWSAQPVSSQFRKAQFSMPGSGAGDAAEVIVYYFGQGGAGGVEANIERWIGQFTGPDGTPPRSAADTGKRTIAGMTVHTVDVTGRYVAETRPGSGQRVDKPDYRMLAAIVETPDGPYFIKAVGPQATIDHHQIAFLGFLGSMRHTPSGRAVDGPGHP